MFKDFAGIMSKVKNLQSDMKTAKAELEQAEVKGTSGGHLVEITMNGLGEVQSIKLDNSIIESSEKVVLEDLITAAVNDANKKSSDLRREKLQSKLGGLPFPGGLDLPL